MKKQNRLIESSANQQGFTLVEFMVASVLGLVVIEGQVPCTLTLNA